jgi:hypothetical protein
VARDGSGRLVGCVGVRLVDPQPPGDRGRSARALYSRHGYVEVPCFTVGDPYAEVWYAKRLS